MNRLLPLVAAALAAWPAPATAADTRPNIVVILVDDLRHDALTCSGHPFVKTPNIDRIAKEGAMFRNFFVTTPLCSPSRASFLTGQYVHRHGIRDNTDRSAASHKLATFPRLLQAAGYETGYFGKWHMGRDDAPRPGFDRWVSFRGQGAYLDPALNIDGKQTKAKGYITDLLTQHAVDFIKKEHKKPFVVYLSHKAVHGPFTPAERHKNLYEDARFAPPPSVVQVDESRKAKPALRAATKGKGPGEVKLTDGKVAAKGFGPMLSQLRCLASIDDGVGAVLRALEATKQLDNTVVVFTSDNGYFWREHGLGDKRWAYEPSLRAPLLVRYPPLVKAGRRLEQMVLNIDLAPTFLDLGKVKVPADVQGRSLAPLLRDEKTKWRTGFLAEYFRDGKFPHPPWQAARTARWKYIRYPDDPKWDELYDLQADPHELKNLASDAGAQARLKQMQDELARLHKEAGAK